MGGLKVEDEVILVPIQGGVLAVPGGVDGYLGG